MSAAGDATVALIVHFLYGAAAQLMEVETSLLVLLSSCIVVTTTKAAVQLFHSLIACRQRWFKLPPRMQTPLARTLASNRHVLGGGCKYQQV